jgi:hypothetical protein
MTDAATAASDRARSMPLTPVDPPAAVIRALEDAALARIDAQTARRFVDLDRRFDRTVSALRQELARRHDHAPEEPVRRPASGWDMAGFLLALAAAPLLLVAGGVSGALPLGVAVAASTALVVAAAVAHAMGGLRARRTASSVASSRHLVLLSAMVSVTVAALVAWRTDGQLTAGIATACGIALVAGLACGVMFVAASRGARTEAAARRAARDAERERRADLEAELVTAIESARAESRALLGGLTAAQRDELRAATAEAVTTLGRRQLLEPGVLRELRAAESGGLRYAVGL